MDQTVTRNAFTGYGAGGEPSYSTSASTFKARFEPLLEMVVGAGGREVVAKGVFIVAETSTGGTPNFGIQDKITDPDSKTPKILRVETVRHFRDGVDHQMVWVI